MILKLLLLTIVLMGIAFALIAIKMFFVKGAVFTKTCSSDLDTHDGKKIECMCEKNPEYHCENYELHHGSNKNHEH